MPAEIELVAADVYRLWCRRVRRASKSVRLFSPYSDQLAVDLLRKSSLSPDEICVVTDLSPESGATDYLGQLRALRRMVTVGFEVRSLPRLHAKVLLTDGRHVTVGSQNFTRYARQSRETTGLPDEDLASSAFVEVLDSWYEESTPISIDLLNELIDALSGAAKTAQQAQAALTAEFGTVLAQREEREAESRAAASREVARRAPLAAGLSDAVTRSRGRAASAPVWARMQLRESTARWYHTFEVDRSGDLRRWVSRAPARELVLEDRGMYPMVLNPSGRVAFVNVRKSCSTFAWLGLKWPRPVAVAGHNVRLGVTFPREVRDGENVEVRLRVHDGEIVLRFRFDGLSAELTDFGLRDYEDSETSDARRIQDALVDDGNDSHRRDLLRLVFEGIRFPEGYKNRDCGIERLIEPSSGWHRVDLIEFLGLPVLVASEL